MKFDNIWLLGAFAVVVILSLNSYLSDGHSEDDDAQRTEARVQAIAHDIHDQGR